MGIQLLSQAFLFALLRPKFLHFLFFASGTANEQRLQPLVDRKVDKVASDLDELLRQLVDDAVKHLEKEIEHAVHFHMQVRAAETIPGG